MSLLTDSPVHSSSSDDFAAFLDAELNSNSSASSLDEDDEDEESNDEEAKDDNELEGKRYNILLNSFWAINDLNFRKCYNFLEVHSKF